MIHSDPIFDPNHPIDVFAEIIEANQWPYERARDGELAVSLTGCWSQYHLLFRWTYDEDVLQLTCGFETDVAPARTNDIHALIDLINRRMPVGHFERAGNFDWIHYRHGVLLKGGAPLSQEQCEDLLEVAVFACDKFYPAFQFLLWAGKTPEGALDAAILETLGEA